MKLMFYECQQYLGSFGLNRHKSLPANYGIWPAGHPLDPLVSGICTLPPRIRYIPGVTLILVEFLISLRFHKMLQCSTYVTEIK
jgi:hypothetical protein